MQNDQEKKLILNFVEDLGIALGEVIQEHLGDMGFFLFVTDPSEPGNNHYITNAEPKEISQLMRKFADYIELTARQGTP